jgi:hypothetical protein
MYFDCYVRWRYDEEWSRDNIFAHMAARALGAILDGRGECGKCKAEEFKIRFLDNNVVISFML